MGNKMNFRRWLLVLGVLVGGVICLQSNNGYATSNSLWEAATGLEQDLGQLEQLLAKLERDLDAQGGISSHLEELAATMSRLSHLGQRVRNEFASFEERIPLILEDEALQQLARHRQTEIKASFEQHWAELAALMTRLSQLNQVPKGKQLATIKDCRQALGLLVYRQHKPLDINNLPLKGVNWGGNSSPSINPPALPSHPTAEDLVPTPEASFSPSIVQLAKALDHNPLKIYRWVKDNIHYLPLFGSIKGASRCLWDREGSDFDQASLLLALLRAAKIPARYVYGQMRLPLETAAEWLGVEEPLVAQAILQRGGIPYQGEVIQRVWVKAYLDNAWLEMDPAFKRSVWGDDAPVDEGLSWVGLPTDERESLQAILGVPLLASSSLAAVQKRPVIEPGLPTHPSQSSLVREWEATQVPVEFQYRLKVELDPVRGDASPCSVELSMAQILTQPLSLLYLPADKQEAQIMDALVLQLEDEADPAPDKIGHLPGYLVRVRPHLLLGDRLIAQGEPVCLGTPQYLSLSFKAPLQPVTPVRHLVVAGTQASLGLNMGSLSLESLNNLGDELAVGGGLAQRLKRYVARIWNEELGLGVFKHTALAYHQQNSRLAQLLAQHNGVYTVPFMGEALVAQSAMVAYAFDIPVFFRYSGVNLDLQRNSFVLTPLANKPAASNQFLAQAGVYGTMLEHRVLEQIDDNRIMNSEAVSAVKALLIAKAQGVPLVHLTGENSSQIWPQLEVSQAILQDIEIAISQGYEVVLPQREISLNDWQGLGYIIRQADTGAGAYLISGGLAGSVSGRGRSITPSRGAPTRPRGGTGLGATATTKLSMGMPRGLWAKILVLVLVLAAVVLVAAI